MGEGATEDIVERDARRLPEALRERASLIDGDHAWRIDDLPDVILTARDAGLINLGGELQFRSSFGYFTCPDVAIELRGNLYDGRLWETQIDASADEALAQLVALRDAYNFVALGERHSPGFFADMRQAGEAPEDAVWFVWRVVHPGSLTTLFAELPIAERQRLGGKYFEIVERADGEIDAVKLGWAWPAFFVTWIWGFVVGLNRPAGVMLAADVVIGISRYFARTAARATPGDALVGWWLSVSILASLTLMILAGTWGNRWRRTELAREGARGIAIVAAPSKRAALDVYRAETRPFDQRT